jgi:hypothetical protein
MLVRIDNIITDGTTAKVVPSDYTEWDSEMSIDEIPYPICAIPGTGSAYFDERARRQVEPTPVLRSPIYKPSGMYRKGKCPTKKTLR